jgi:hypothetical protein
MGCRPSKNTDTGVVELKNGIEYPQFKPFFDLITSLKCISANIINVKVDRTADVDEKFTAQLLSLDADRRTIARTIKVFLIFIKHEMKALVESAKTKEGKINYPVDLTFEGLSLKEFVEHVAKDCFSLAHKYVDLAQDLNVAYAGQIWVKACVGNLLTAAGIIGGIIVIYSTAGTGTPLVINAIAGVVATFSVVSGVLIAVTPTETEVCEQYMKDCAQGLKVLGADFDELSSVVHSTSYEVYFPVFNRLFNCIDGVVTAIEKAVA